MQSILRCEICDCILQSNKKVNCGKKECQSATARIRYRINKNMKLSIRPCPCCNKIIPNKYNEYCSDLCSIECGEIGVTERRFIKQYMHNIVQLAKLAKLLPENKERISCIEERLYNKYGKKYKYSLPYTTILTEYGFTEDVEIMSEELYVEGLLSGSSYWEVACDISIYRKLFDYGLILGLIE